MIPSSIKSDDDPRRYFEEFMSHAQRAYSFTAERMNEKGLMGESANQDARFVLPNACETKIIVTMNARELLHFFSQSCCNRSRWEIRALAIEMLRLAKSVSPAVFEKGGPTCLRGAYPEGEYSCGKMKEVRAFFTNMKNIAQNIEKVRYI